MRVTKQVFDQINQAIMKFSTASRMEKDIGEIQRKELRFTFEPKKHISCILKLANNSNRHIAFKVKTTHPKLYQVKPPEGIVKPFSICEVTFTRIGEIVAPLPNVIEKEKFLVQTTFVSKDTSAHDVSSIFLSKGIVKRETKVKVYVDVKPGTEAQQIKLMQSEIEELRLRVKKCEKMISEPKKPKSGYRIFIKCFNTKIV